MKIPLEITVRGMPHSEAVEAKVRQRAMSLQRFSHRVQRCEVWVDAAHGHHRKGYHYGVRVRLTIPNDEICVELQPGEEDVYVAIRDAFDAVRRQLEDSERRRPGHTRGHEQAHRGSRSGSGS